jgi:hypothetical protein
MLNSLALHSLWILSSTRHQALRIWIPSGVRTQILKSCALLVRDIQPLIKLQLIILKAGMSRKSGHVCLCISYKCANRTITLPSGETQAGKFVSRQTLNKHCKADEALYENMKNEGLQSVDCGASNARNGTWFECTLMI